MNQHDTPAKVASTDGLGLVQARCNAGTAAFAHNAETPLYTANEVRAMLAAECEWCAQLCDSETLIQHGEFGAGWVEGAKACGALIRKAVEARANATTGGANTPPMRKQVPITWGDGWY